MLHLLNIFSIRYNISLPRNLFHSQTNQAYRLSFWLNEVQWDCVTVLFILYITYTIKFNKRFKHRLYTHMDSLQAKIKSQVARPYRKPKIEYLPQKAVTKMIKQISSCTLRKFVSSCSQLQLAADFDLPLPTIYPHLGD